MTTDASIVLQGEISTFYYRQDDLTSSPTFVGLFGESIIDGLTKSLGDLTPVIAKDPIVPNKFRIVRKTRGAPELGELTINEYIKRNTRAVVERVAKQFCDHVFFVKIDSCGRPDDVYSWDSVWVVTGAQMVTLEPGTLQQRDTSDPVEVVGTLSTEDFERLFTVRLGEKAGDLVISEVLDVIYADQQSCGSCAPYSSGCSALYGLTRANVGSPGLSSQLVYTLNGSDYSKIDIAALGGNEGNKIQAVGRYLVVISETLGGHVYIEKASLSASGWTVVTTGYEAGGSPRAIYSLSPQITYIGGQGGYLYKASDITVEVEVIHDASLTSQNCNAIHANGAYVLSGHDSNALLFSSNYGATFSLVMGPEVGVNIRAVWVRSATQWWVGTASGKLWYTVDGGTTWTQRTLPNQATLSEVLDIKFSPDFAEVGAIAVQTTGNTAAIYRTLTGGRIWLKENPGIIQLGTAPERLNAVALCGVDNIATGGKKVGSSDGVLAVAE